MPEPSPFAERCVALSGGESGIGRAVAIAFARAGARVAFTYLSERELAAQTERAASGGPGRAIGYPCDVGERADVERFFEAARGRFGAPTILVNCAGINVRDKTIEELSLGEWEATLRTNLTGPFLMVKAFLASLPAAEKAAIVNVSSVHEEMPAWRVAEYCAAKGGLRNFMQCLALELAPRKINVNNVAPGTVLTRMNQALLDDPRALAEHEATIPLGRGAAPEEIAHAVLFLASDAAAYITGTTLTVDGGMLLNVDTGSASDPNG